MRKALFLTVAVLSILAVAAAGSIAAPRSGGVLKWRIINDPPALDPVTSNITTATRGTNLYLETLVKTSSEGEILPSLAKNWDVNDDSTVWTFHLRPEVRFQKTVLGEPTLNGGRKMTAEDVKYSFERLVKMKSARVFFADKIKGYNALNDGEASEWSGIKVIDDHTVQFTLEEPFAPFLAVLTYPSFGVVPKEDAEKWGKEFSFHPVGTGPFALAEWKHDSLAAFRRNPDYWAVDENGTQLPYLEGVDLVVLPDNGVAFMEFKKGNIDVLPDIPDEYYEPLQKDFPDGFQERPGLNTYYYGMSQLGEPFKENLKLRQAMNCAVNRKAINELVLNGRYEPAKGVLPPGMPGYTPDLRAYEYDPAKAKALLKEAGYGDGLELTLHFNNNPRHRSIAEAMQAQLAEVGITLKLASSEVGAHYEAVRRGDFGFFRAGWAGDYADPDNFLYTLFCSDNFGPKGNYCRYKNDQVDAWLKEARRETVPAKRWELYKKAEQQIVDDAVWMFLFYQTTSLVARPEVQGLKLAFLGDYMTELTQVWLDKK
ncbi:MAG: peptide ABC transporter substrate-binding protein [Dethiosulfovibrio peptidovorans]|nr:MAG: peptide ABC transporter substrate-binding protein [Dethiosulfovibrio peptidovorans]